MADMQDRERWAEIDVQAVMLWLGRHISLVLGVASLATVFGAAAAFIIQKLLGR